MSDFLIGEPPKCKILALTVCSLVVSSAGGGYEGVSYFLLYNMLSLYMASWHA